MDSGKPLIAKFPRPTRDPWSVILLERFDRKNGERIGYVSALTMLEARDNDRRSYTEIAEVIETVSPSVTEDLRELWRRVAFSILISNADDHLRNHGFLRIGAGWILSPAFDLNPAPDSAGLLSTAIETPRDRNADIGLLVDWAEYFRVTDPADELRRLLDATGTWRERAERYGVASETTRLAPAFEHEQREAARRLAAR